MVNQMKKHPDIARNLTKKDPGTIQKFWEELKKQLNSLGPPSKEVAEWKKVWSDHKSALRKKLAHQKRELRATGGGENKEIYFTSPENVVIELVCLKDCVEGLPETRCYGSPRIQKPLNETVVTSIVFEETEVLQNVGTEMDSENNPNTSNIFPTESAERTRNHAVPKPLQLLQHQINIQEQLCEKISEVLSKIKDISEDTNSSIKKIYRSLDRLADYQKKANEVHQSLIDETKRHNERMEYFAKEKNATKKQLLEIQLSQINAEIAD